MAPPRRVAIRTPSIELGALLKWVDLAATGGEAKGLIQEGRVSVNGTVERRRGRRLCPGDRVEVGGHAVLIERGAS
jgi:ribosome-associated protein